MLIWGQNVSQKMYILLKKHQSFLFEGSSLLAHLCQTCFFLSYARVKHTATETPVTICQTKELLQETEAKI